MSREGWDQLVDLTREAAELSNNPLSYKEKFGALRIELIGSDQFGQFADFIEALSETVCQACGRPGHLRTDLSWFRTLCDEHYEALTTTFVGDYFRMLETIQENIVDALTPDEAELLLTIVKGGDPHPAKVFVQGRVHATYPDSPS